MTATIAAIILLLASGFGHLPTPAPCQWRYWDSSVGVEVDGIEQELPAYLVACIPTEAPAVAPQLTPTDSTPRIEA